MWTKEQRKKYAYSEEERKQYRQRPEVKAKRKTEAKNYYLTHKEYFQSLKQRRKKQLRKWQLKHPERVKKFCKQFYQSHKIQVKEQVKIWIKNHSKQRKVYMKKYVQYPKVKIQIKKYRRRNKAKRRNLGFNPFNEPFIGSVGHHIDFECVIYIPRELHISIPHCIWTGRNMREINNKVFTWLEPSMEQINKSL